MRSCGDPLTVAFDRLQKSFGHDRAVVQPAFSAHCANSLLRPLCRLAPWRVLSLKRVQRATSDIVPEKMRRRAFFFDGRVVTAERNALHLSLTTLRLGCRAMMNGDMGIEGA
jgi:hypothetical protein